MPSPEKFIESLKMFCVEENIREQINEGFEGIVSKTPKKRKAAYFKRAIDIMTEKVDPEKLQEVFEWNACCKSGARERHQKPLQKK